jgi:hypothetical protein
VIKTEVIRDYIKRGWTRWGAPQQIDPHKMIDEIVNDVLTVIENTKPPTKNHIIKAVKQHFYGD